MTLYPLIRIGCIALLTASALFAQDPTLQELFAMPMEELMRVTVTTAGREEQQVGEVPASVVIVTREDIERFGYASLDRILENVPGLFNIDNRFEGSIFGVRGFWSAVGNNIILLINGVRQERMESDGTVYPSVKIPPEAIDRIEVVRGPMSLIYGPGAFFGAINIITNDAAYGSRVTLSAGLEKTVRATARAAVTRDDLSLVFNVGYMETDGPDIPHSRMTSMDWTRFGTHFTSTKGRWGSRQEYFSLSGGFRGFYTNFQYHENYREWYLFQPPNTSDGSKNWRNYSTLSFGYRHDFSAEFALDTRLSYRRGSTRGNFGWNIPAGGMNISGDINHKDDFEVDVTAFFHPRSGMDMTAGLYYKKKTTDQLQGTYPQFGGFLYRLGLVTPLQRFAAYVQTDFDPVPWMKLILGGRVERIGSYEVFSSDLLTLTGTTAEFDYDKTDFIPRIASIFHLNDRHILKVMYGRAITMPSSFKTIARISNPMQPPVEPEFISTLECNYLAAFTDRFSVNVSLFYNDLENLIVSESDWNEEGTEFIPLNKNSGRLKTLGMEMTVNVRPLNRLSLEISGTWQKTEDQRREYRDIEVAYSPRALAYFKAAYQAGENTSLALIGRFVGSMETYWDETRENPDGSFGGRIADSVDGYMTLGANLRFNCLFGSRFFLNINGSNLLNTEYLFPSYFFNAIFADKGMPGYGRMVMVTVGSTLSKER